MTWLCRKLKAIDKIGLVGHKDQNDRLHTDKLFFMVTAMFIRLDYHHSYNHMCRTERHRMNHKSFMVNAYFIQYTTMISSMAED